VQHYVVRRLLLAVPTLLALSVVIFVMLRIVPGDPVDVYVTIAQVGRVDDAEREKIRKKLGLDRHISIQYGVWLKGVFTGDFGQSLRYQIPAWDIIKGRIPVSIQVGVMGLIIAVLVGIPLGVISAMTQDSWLDQGLRLVSLLGLSMPSFWVAILIVTALIYFFFWIPPVIYVSPFDDFTGNMSQFIFPALVLGFNSSAFILRMTRSSMLEVLREDYVRTARAKGLTERVVISRHTLKNAFIPVITVIAFQVPLMIGSMVVIETVFNLPGASRFMSDAIIDRDLTMVQGLVMLTGILVVISNLIADLLYGWLNPRVRFE
jgi:peptide/nickel transport system permease protein